MLILMLLSGLVVSEAQRVLVVFPLPEKSHSVLGDSLVDTLLGADYEVTYVTPYPEEARLNLEYVDVSSILGEIHVSDAEQTSDAEDKSSPRYLPSLGTRFAKRVLKHSGMQELMMNTSLVYDAVLVGWFHTGLLAPLAEIFECPLIWYTPTDISSQSLSLVGNTPALDVPLNPNSLANRVHHMWSQMYFQVWNYLHILKVEIPAYEENYREAFKAHFRFLPNYESVVFNGSLLLYNSHPLLGPAVPLPGNVKYIGGHHISETASPLPKNLKKVMDRSANGVIYVNMESNLISSDIHNQITREFKQVFSELNQTVIWKYDGILVNLPQNVYTMKTPPQYSILNHVNTIAFINHGDMFSILDATHYGVPVISLPLLEDQAANVISVIKRGCGVKIDFRNIAWELKKSVEAILNNRSYKTNAKKANAIFRHRLAPPQKEFLHHVETVIRTRGAAHLRPPALHTSILERYNVDLMCLVLMVLWFLTKVARVVNVHLDTSNEDHEKEE